MSDGMTLYIDNAKMFASLSTGALVLSIAFVRDVLGVPRDQPIPRNWWLIGSWFFFLVSIVSSTLYQYAAAGYVAGKRGQANVVFDITWPFGFMLAGFYLGAICFGVMALTRTIRLPREEHH